MHGQRKTYAACRDVANAIRPNGGRPVPFDERKLSDTLGFTSRTARRWMEALVDHGLARVVSDGGGRGKRRSWILTPSRLVSKAKSPDSCAC